MQNNYERKIGVFTPTYDRPDFIRGLVLQMNNQSVKPDVLVIHQNNQKDSYKWAIDDIDTSIKIIWLHNESVLNQDLWYLIPLDYLIGLNCTHYFWCDHDDIYFRNHIEESIKTIDSGYDYSINSHCGLLLLNKKYYLYKNNVRFKGFDENGHASSMCFNNKFAVELSKDIRLNGGILQVDVVVGRNTKLKFNHIVKDTNNKQTTAYVCHDGTLTSSHLLD